MKRRIHLQKIACLTVAMSVAAGSWAADNGRTMSGPQSALTATNVLTLDAAIALALTNNPGLRASGGRVEAAAGRAQQARLWSNPELSFASEDIPLKNGSFRDSKNTIGLAQTVPYPGKKKLEGQIGTSGVRMSEAELGLRRITLVRDAKAAFYRVLAAERLVGVAGELVQMAESSAATARKRVEAGAAGDQEQLRAEIQLEQAHTELSAREQEVVAARHDLSSLLGCPECNQTRLAGALADTPDTSVLQSRPEQWLFKHPGMVAARLARDRSELEVKRSRLEPYPDVTVGVSGGREGRDDTGIVEFRVALPLPIIDRSKGRQHEAQANLVIAQAELMATEQELRRDWEVASKRFQTAADQVSSYRERILPKADHALKLVRAGFDQGKFGLMDLLDTQRTAAEARLAYQQKLLELNVAQAELEALSGGSRSTQQ